MRPLAIVYKAEKSSCSMDSLKFYFKVNRNHRRKYGATNWKISDTLFCADWIVAVREPFNTVQIVSGDRAVDIFHILHNIQVPLSHGSEECQRSNIFFIRVPDGDDINCENAVAALSK